MRRIRSEIADEIMRDYYRELLWKERIRQLKEKEQEEKNKKNNISDTR